MKMNMGLLDLFKKTRNGWDRCNSQITNQHPLLHAAHLQNKSSSVPQFCGCQSLKNISQPFTRTCYSCLALRRAQTGPSDNSHHLPFSSAHPAIHYSELSAWEVAAESRHNQGNTGSIFFLRKEKEKKNEAWMKWDWSVCWKNTSSPDITCLCRLLLCQLHVLQTLRVWCM